jgi:hypothetical protein
MTAKSRAISSGKHNKIRPPYKRGLIAPKTAYSHSPKCAPNTLTQFQKLQKEFAECIKG